MVTLLVSLVLGASDLSCAVMGSPAPINTVNALDYAGVRYPFCCGGCDATFGKEPSKYVLKAAKEGKAIGYFLFEPTTGAKLDSKKLPTLYADHKGVRYFFASADNKKAFDADHARFDKPITKEVMYCSVMDHAIDGVGAAGSYADFEGVRYYFCCMDCNAAFKKEPTKYAESVKGKIQESKATKPAKGS
jgi:YHS domain-containing protein